MLLALLVVLILLWIGGYLPLAFFPLPTLVLFSLNAHPITLWNILLFLLILWIISLLPRPFREIVSILFLIWILSVLGILFPLAISSPAIVLIILGLIIFLFVT